MDRKNVVYIARSLDGFIAGKNGEIDWLHAIPNPEQSDMGFAAFMEGIDALVMGRSTFDTVCGFEGEWPYNKPVFVLSNTLTEIPERLAGKAQIVSGPLVQVLEQLNTKGFNRLYIDGGKTIQAFLAEDLIDEMIIATIPILLGEGISLFGHLDAPLHFEHVNSQVHLGAITQDHYRKKRD